MTTRRKLHFESFTLEESFRERKGKPTGLFLEKMELRKGRRKRKQRQGGRRGSPGRHGSPQGRARSSDARQPSGARWDPSGPRAAAAGSEQPAPGRLSGRPPVGPSVLRGPRGAALSASAFPRPAASGSAPGQSGRAADNLWAAVSLPGLKFTGTASVPPACAPAAVLESEAPAGEKNAPRGLGLHLRGSPAIREETKRLFPLIWFYRDLMWTLNFECFYLFQSLSFPFWEGIPGPAANSLRGRDAGTGISRSGGRRVRGGGAGGRRRWAQPPPTASRNSGSPGVPPPLPRSRARPLSTGRAREAGARYRLGGQTRAPGGAGRGAAEGLGRRRRASVLPSQPPNPSRETELLSGVDHLIK